MEEGDSRATVISSSDKGERETDAGDLNGFRIIITFGCCILIFVMFVVVLVVLLLFVPIHRTVSQQGHQLFRQIPPTFCSTPFIGYSICTTHVEL